MWEGVVYGREGVMREGIVWEGVMREGVMYSTMMIVCALLCVYMGATMG